MKVRNTGIVSLVRFFFAGTVAILGALVVMCCASPPEEEDRRSPRGDQVQAGAAAPVARGQTGDPRAIRGAPMLASDSPTWARAGSAVLPARSRKELLRRGQPGRGKRTRPPGSGPSPLAGCGTVTYEGCCDGDMLYCRELLGQGHIMPCRRAGRPGQALPPRRRYLRRGVEVLRCVGRLPVGRLQERRLRVSRLGRRL